MNKITLATLAQASAKEVLDQVSTHLLRQGERALNEAGECDYRTKEGLACAIGCLMTDKEARNTPNDDWEELARTGVVPSAHSVLLYDLQGVHDHAPPEVWASRLKVIRERLASGLYEE